MPGPSGKCGKGGCGASCKCGNDCKCCDAVGDACCCKSGGNCECKDCKCT